MQLNIVLVANERQISSFWSCNFKCFDANVLCVKIKKKRRIVEPSALCMEINNLESQDLHGKKVTSAR